MAMMDDVSFLISHIRNSFITSDETGMCELIIEADDISDTNTAADNIHRRTSWQSKVESKEPVLNDSSSLDSDTELSHSYDILPDMGFAAHRRRSNTAQRLEKLKREKHKQSKIKHVAWKDPDNPPTAEDQRRLFDAKEVKSVDRTKAVVSCLAQQLDNFATANNPFLEYAKFDGKVHAGIPTKKIDIYLTMAPPDQRPYPMTVVTLVTAKVQDLIGLICWQYVTEGRQPELKETVDAYSLHIAEDDGEVDMDFPKLDKREVIQKFGFSKLALVEKDIPKANESKPSIVVTINMPDRGFSKVSVDSDGILLRDLLEKVLKRRKLRQVKGLEYTLERQTEAGVPVDLDIPLSSMDTFEFCLVRENSIRGDWEGLGTPCKDSSAMAESLSSHQYRSYLVSKLHRLRTNSEVQLGISGDKIEIDPIMPKSKLFKEHPLTYDTENIAACTLLEEKSSGKATLRLVYRASHDYKHHDFEAETSVAKEIVSKVNNILEMRSSPVRKEYLAHRVRKLQKRHTIGF